MTMRRRWLWSTVLFVQGCGGGTTVTVPSSTPNPVLAAPGGAAPKTGAPPKSALAPKSGPTPNNGPDWAADGDRETNTGYRFVCQGEGVDADAATTTARAFCEDKICKLCGVEVESIVQSRETLTGVELRREVVERCRRVRTKPLKIARQSLDCPRAGACVAWLEIDYSKAQRRQECQRLTEESFADPAVCEGLIDQFRQTRGYTAASFRTRVDLLQRAMTACENIDVRPTPLLTALDEKLRRGMATFVDERGRAPRFLAQHWLSRHAPMWDEYPTAGTFIGKIRLLLGYLQSKPPILDIIESSLRPPDQLDTPEGFGDLVALLKKTAVDHGYGRSGAHFFALDRIRQMHRQNMFGQPLAPLWSTMTALYAPPDVTDWNRVLNLTWLASADGEVNAEEWAYFMKVPRWWARTAQMLLAVDNHGTDAIREQRYEFALSRALKEAKRNDKPARAVKRVLPTSPVLLDLESLVPTAARPTVFGFDALKRVYSRLDDDIKTSDRDRFLARMLRSAADAVRDPQPAGRACNQLSRRLEFLEQRGVPVKKADEAICWCLTHDLADKGMSLSSKRELYDRALDRDLPCVRAPTRKDADS